MNSYCKQFFLRGMLFGGFGPIIAGLVYLILSYSIENFSLTGSQVFTAILSTYLLAFVQAGVSVFHQIEHWSLPRALFCHLGVLYVCYTLCYLVNTWIPFEPMVLLTFTGIFVVGYAAVYVMVFLAIKITSKKMNQKLHTR